MSLVRLFLVLLFYTLKCDSTEYVIMRFEGTVPRENFSYYYIGTTENIILQLTSLTGDADIYISQFQKHPSFDPTQYDLHAATCGVDLIEIPKSFKRPFVAAIYGHSAHEESEYVLEVIQRDSYEKDHFEHENQKISSENVVAAKTKKENDPTKKKQSESYSKAGIWAFIEIFQLIFL